MKKYRTMDEFVKDYEEHPEFFNMMVDVQSIQEMGPYYKPVISMKFLDTTPDGGDIYIQKHAGDDFYGNPYKEIRYSVTRPGLLKIKSVAKGTFLNPIFCYDKEKNADVCTATLQYVGAKEGDWLFTSCSKEVLRMAKKKAGGTYENSEPLRKAESGAQDACIREAFKIRGHYSIEQLQKPFTMVYWDLDETKDDRILEARINKGISAAGMIYGRALQASQQLQALTEARTDVDKSTGEIIEQDYEACPPDVENSEKPNPWENAGPEKYFCSNPECKAEIARNVYDASIKKFGAAACIKCQQLGGKKGGK
jgi:hypothetical protein